jgi:hypothetical protein
MTRREQEVQPSLEANRPCRPSGGFVTRFKGSENVLDRNNELSAWDRDHFFHPSTHMGEHARGESPTRVIGGGEGVYITDTSGTKSLVA